MRPLSLPPPPVSTDPESRWNWIVNVFQEIERASQDNAIEVFDSYASDQTPSPAVRSLNVATPTTSNLAQTLASLIADMQARGVNRVQPT